MVQTDYWLRIVVLRFILGSDMCRSHPKINCEKFLPKMFTGNVLPECLLWLFIAVEN